MAPAKAIFPSRTGALPRNQRRCYHGGSAASRSTWQISTSPGSNRPSTACPTRKRSVLLCMTVRPNRAAQDALDRYHIGASATRSPPPIVRAEPATQGTCPHPPHRHELRGWGNGGMSDRTLWPPTRCPAPRTTRSPPGGADRRTGGGGHRLQLELPCLGHLLELAQHDREHRSFSGRARPGARAALAFCGRAPVQRPGLHQALRGRRRGATSTS